MDNLGDRMKLFEQAEAGRKACKGLPLMARLDGRSFHSYTKGLKRPYDVDLTECMISTTIHLVKEFHCLVGYTQSDEISLMWYLPEDSESDYIFSGKYQKICSSLAASASAFFARETMRWLPEKNNMLPTFDCRVWQVPSEMEAVNTFFWRELDASKNAVSMAAHAYFSNATLHKLNSTEKKALLLQEKGIQFENYPIHFKRGTYVKRATRQEELSPEIIAKIPKDKEIPQTVTRSSVISVYFPDYCNKLGIQKYSEYLFEKIDY